MNCDSSLPPAKKPRMFCNWTEDDIDSLLRLVYRNRIGLFSDNASCNSGSTSNSLKGVESVLESKE